MLEGTREAVFVDEIDELSILVNRAFDRAFTYIVDLAPCENILNI